MTYSPEAIAKLFADQHLDLAEYQGIRARLHELDEKAGRHEEFTAIELKTAKALQDRANKIAHQVCGEDSKLRTSLYFVSMGVDEQAYDAINERRIALIQKQHKRGLSEEETQELANATQSFRKMGEAQEPLTYLHIALMTGLGGQEEQDTQSRRGR